MKYETAAETAKKIRKALKASFPGVKFRVRSQVYSMGSSVNISYTDGPAVPGVESVCRRYESSSFDGMTDLKTVHGYEDPETGEPCCGTHNVSVTRDLSFDLMKRLASEILKRHGMADDPDAVTIKEEPPRYSRRTNKMTKGHSWISVKHIILDERMPYPNDLRTAIWNESHGRNF